jgi:hypothetical protein
MEYSDLISLGDHFPAGFAGQICVRPESMAGEAR